MTTSNTPANPGNLENLFPATNLAKEFPHLFTDRQANWAVRNRATNGLDEATINIGRRLFIDRDALAGWIFSQNGEVMA